MKLPVKNILCVSLVGLSAAVGLLRQSITAGMVQQNTVEKTNGRPVAVLELFTSEGCSSCPPADSNLQRISKMKQTADGTVIPLSLHADHWNYLRGEDHQRRARSVEQIFPRRIMSCGSDPRITV